MIIWFQLFLFNKITLNFFKFKLGDKCKNRKKFNEVLFFLNIFEN